MGITESRCKIDLNVAILFYLNTRWRHLDSFDEEWNRTPRRVYSFISESSSINHLYISAHRVQQIWNFVSIRCWSRGKLRRNYHLNNFPRSYSLYYPTRGSVITGFRPSCFQKGFYILLRFLVMISFWIFYLLCCLCSFSFFRQVRTEAWACFCFTLKLNNYNKNI